VETVPAKKHEKGVTPPKNETHVDHKTPKVKGGPGEVDNAQVLCRDCNLKKGSKEPEQEPVP
jgi:5-methylcytosine-specific restriction endonuclease McrA